MVNRAAESNTAQGPCADIVARPVLVVPTSRSTARGGAAGPGLDHRLSARSQRPGRAVRPLYCTHSTLLCWLRKDEAQEIFMLEYLFGQTVDDAKSIKGIFPKLKMWDQLSFMFLHPGKEQLFFDQIDTETESPLFDPQVLKSFCSHIKRLNSNANQCTKTGWPSLLDTMMIYFLQGK